MKKYYRELKKYYKHGNASVLATNALSDVEKRDLTKIEEYKVSFDIFEKHVSLAGLKIDQDIKVWQPKSLQGDNAGSHVIVLKHADKK